MHFRSTADLARDVSANLHRLPHDIDIVVGVPRSGMLVATMIALARNLPLTDLDSFAAERAFERGKTRLVSGEQVLEQHFDHALVVDDSSMSGRSIAEARAKLAHFPFGARQSYAVAYGHAASNADIDYVFDQIPSPRVFEWNVLHHPHLEQACVDIDGVLCLDPRDDENDDGPAYLGFLERATLLHRPRRQIRMLVTNRLEKYRMQTEAWLERHGVQYGRLEMLGLPDGEARRRMRPYAGFKANTYRRSDTRLFIESEARQAREIARLSGKPVLSLEGPHMYYPHPLAPVTLRHQLGPRKIARELARKVLGDSLYMRLRARRNL